MGIVKNQHYVPQCYLKNFKIIGQNKNIVNVFDKRENMVRYNQNIDNVCSERYFYDLTDENKEGAQHVEKWFSENIEPIYSKLLASIIQDYEGRNVRLKQISKTLEFKMYMSRMIAIQYMRTRKTRENIVRMVEEIAEWIKVDRETKNIYLDDLELLHETTEYIRVHRNIDNVLKFNDTLTDEAVKWAFVDRFENIIDFKKNAEKRKDTYIYFDKDFYSLIHFFNLYDDEFIENLARGIFNCIWVISINKTKIPFFTSDNPVLLNKHKKSKGNRCNTMYNNYFENINSTLLDWEFMWNYGDVDGLSIGIPINPYIYLNMYHRNSFPELIKFEYSKYGYTYLDSSNIKLINNHNLLQCINSTRSVISSSGDEDTFIQIQKHFTNLYNRYGKQDYDMI